MSKNRPARHSDDLLRGLLHAVYWLDESLQQSLEASGVERIPRAWSLIMVNLSDGVTRPSQLASNLGVSRQAIHITLKDMQDSGLVKLIDDPDDKRAKIVEFNPAAEYMRRAALHGLRDIEAELARRIGRRRFDAMKEALRLDWGPLVIAQRGARKSGAAKR